MRFLWFQVINYINANNHTTIVGSTVCAQRSHSRPHTQYLTHVLPDPQLPQPSLTLWPALCCGAGWLSSKIFKLLVIAVNRCANLYSVMRALFVES